MSSKRISRREMLKTGAAAGMAGLLSSCGGRNIVTGNPAPSACAKVTDIEHVVMLIQENRSFDHFFGSYPGVRGFADQSPAFQQPYPGNTSIAPAGVLLPCW